MDKNQTYLLTYWRSPSTLSRQTLRRRMPSSGGPPYFQIAWSVRESCLAILSFFLSQVVDISEGCALLFAVPQGH